ncbi:MAG: OmpA family protein [Rhizobiaceae bacterium]
MKFNSNAFAGTALGLLMAATSANAAGIGASAERATVKMPIILAQADLDNPDQKPNKKERRGERRAEKNSQAGGADQGGAQQPQEMEQPKHQRRKAVEEEQPGGNAGQAQRNARQAPASEEEPAMRPERGKKRHADEAGGGQAAQGGNDIEQPMQSKRKHRERNEANQPGANGQAPENAQANEPDQGQPEQGKKHRRNDKNARRGEDNGQAAEEKAAQPKAGESQAKSKAEQKAGEEPQNGGNLKANEKNAGEAEQDRKHGKNRRNAEEKQGGENGNAATGEAEQNKKFGKNAERKQGGENGNAATGEAEQNNKLGKNARNAKGQENGNGQAGENKTETGQAAQKPEEKQKQPEENAGTAGKQQNEQARKERGKNGENGQNAQGEQNQGAQGQAAQGGQGAEGGGNVVLPKSLNGQRAGEGRKRERRNAAEQNGNAENAVLPDSARGRHGQRQEAGRNAKAAPLPDSDAAAQADFQRPERIQSITAVQGKRIDKPERVYRDHPDNVKVVKQIDNRTIIEVNNQEFVRGSDRPRITHDARDVYYEDLPHDRTREVVVRPDGSRVVTIRNEYGDVIRRSRITRDNREIVLVYVDDRDLERDRGWADVGSDLPPLVVDVPQDDYILEADDVHDPDRYYTFLEQPPIEPVRRLYTLGEVKRSARIRDIMPRIDLDTITFDFGSAKVGEDQADKLQAVADAIKKILDDNPAETFLIEGHTDAVGSDQANLVLSDERADSVASLLTSMFDIPAENLTTQGYGEQYLKVDTQEANRQNRRVTIRRITPLVAPVASAQ